MNKKIFIIGGGTVSHVRSHMALCAPAYGTTAKYLAKRCKEHSDNKLDVKLILTKMAGGHIETNEDVNDLVNEIIGDTSAKIVFFNPALVDFSGTIMENGKETESGKYKSRLQTRNVEQYAKKYDPTNLGDAIDHLRSDPFSFAQNPYIEMRLRPTEKLAKKIRKTRKDIFLVTFKTTTGATEQEQYLAGLSLLKETSSNLVLANDTKTRINMIITPEEASYHVSTDREYVLQNLVTITLLRSHLTFTRSTIVSGNSVSWSSELIPNSLRKVIDFCIYNNAYKTFNGSTVGHFAVKLSETVFLTSKRKTNFNDLENVGLVMVQTDGPDNVIAYGSKPSVGGQSQRIVFSEHPGYDCIVHFHCPIREGSRVPVMSQREFECGSHECGQNTSNGLAKFGNLKAVYLDNHGPNIVFNKDIDPEEVIRFIVKNFDLSKKTGGYNLK